LALLVSLLALPGSVGAQGTLEVLKAGWNGTIRPGTWAPVEVRVTGAGPAADALVEVVLLARTQTSPGTTGVEYATASYGQDVALPPGVTKEITIWFPTDNVAAGLVRLSVGGRIEAEQRVDFRAPTGSEATIVGVLAESPAVVRSVAQIEQRYQGLPVPVGMADLEPGDVPAQGEYLSGLNALVVQGDAPVSLTSEQRRAIRDWVLDGGHLLLAGGPTAPRTASALPPDTLPLSYGTPDSAGDLGPLLVWADLPSSASGAPLARLRPTAGTALAGPRDQPLVWRQELGHGTITVLAADPALEPLASASTTPTLLRKALEPALPSLTSGTAATTARFPVSLPYGGPYTRGYGTSAGPSALVGVTNSLPADAFPSWRAVGLLLGGFALAVSLVGHVALRIVRRREWVWLAVPAAAVAVSVGLYAIGIRQGGRDVLSHVVSHVEIDPERHEGRQMLAAGFYAPTHDQLQVTMPGDGPVVAVAPWQGPSPFGYGASVGAAPSDPPAQVVHGRETRAQFGAGEWTMRTVTLERSLGPEVGAITAHLSIEDGLAKGSLRNDTPYLLEDVALAVGSSIARVGTLAPGQTAPAVLSTSESPPSPSNPMTTLSAQLFGNTGSSVATMGYPGAYTQPGEPEARRRMALMDAVLSYGSGPYARYSAPVAVAMPGASNLPLTVFAYTQDQVGPTMPSVGGRPAHYLTLFQQTVRLDLTPGHFAIPSGFIPLASTSSSTSGTTGTVEQTNIYRYSLPLPTTAHVETLVLEFSDGASQAPFNVYRPPNVPSPRLPPGLRGPDQLLIYDWEEQTWTTLPADEKEVRLESAARFVSPDGIVQVQARARPVNGPSFAYPPTIAAEGWMPG
jgi:hypothetical protein